MIFYKENKLNQKFDVPENELKKRYAEWLDSKDPEWVKRYHSILMITFVSSEDGLNATPDDPSMYGELEQMFGNITDKYFKTI